MAAALIFLCVRFVVGPVAWIFLDEGAGFFLLSFPACLIGLFVAFFWVSFLSWVGHSSLPLFCVVGSAVGCLLVFFSVGRSVSIVRCLLVFLSLSVVASFGSFLWLLTGLFFLFLLFFLLSVWVCMYVCLFLAGSLLGGSLVGLLAGVVGVFLALRVCFVCRSLVGRCFVWLVQAVADGWSVWLSVKVRRPSFPTRWLAVLASLLLAGPAGRLP
ncbi:hypothetical protein [Pseudomonas syringae]|uniref:hypothetical protein n=1 Tax=Pseudomonas syringae TaxID=317 RepID=UPI001141FFA8|nr:hypothetical protein [Pseudomonas syringae]